ncbi:hypothetical protein [Sulfurimonas sp.]|uniref:hypothetical protein n=1 Tax=Sulfurimonas sp. TaxID=2022749 RepID=UPI002635FA48|nr:hypothetical protein [Sulfurimonas sp.]
MKNVLGSLLLFLFIQNLSASQLAEYKFSVSNSHPCVKEAVEITFKARQKDHTDVMFFFLKPRLSDDYQILLLNKVAKDINYHDKESTFTYLLFPNKSKKINIKFDFVIKMASDKAVAQVYEGGRDNVKWIDTMDRKIDLNPLHLDVEALKEDVSLVGDFRISSKLDKEHITAFESANITYFLQGTGYNAIDINIIDNIQGVKIFSDTIKHYNKATKDGYKLQREFKYALLADKNFTIASKNIQCYSPKNKKYYTLKTKEYNLTVEKQNLAKLIDTQEFPKETKSFTWLYDFFIYIIIFMSGFLSAKFFPNSINIFQNKNIYSDIKNAKNAKKLLNILMQKYNIKELKNEIAQLEAIAYGNSKASLRKIKKKIIAILNESK